MDHAMDDLAGTHFRNPFVDLFQANAMGNKRPRIKHVVVDPKLSSK